MAPSDSDIRTPLSSVLSFNQGEGRKGWCVDGCLDSIFEVGEGVRVRRLLHPIGNREKKRKYLEDGRMDVMCIRSTSTFDRIEDVQSFNP